jgi:5'-nucleotidase
MIADAFRAAARADVALENNGGIRADLEAGAVSWGQLFEVLPFQNMVVKLTLTGAELRRVIEHAVGGADARAHVSGLRVRIDPARPAGQRITSIALEGGRPLDDSARYTLATLDFLATGGSGYSMLRGLAMENTGVTDLDAFIAHLRSMPQPVRGIPVERRIDDGSPVEERPRADDIGVPSRRRRP